MSRTGQTLTYKYNADGLRTQKSDGTTTTNYYWTGGRVTHMTRGSTYMHLYYDQAGRPMLVSYNGTNYYYKLNLQGDVIGIINTSSTEVVSYTYDAWGKQQTCTGSQASALSADNPLRYRGYIYDIETGLYYLQARYYNPDWGRFISADTVLGVTEAINTYNVFTYCLNNPINMSDPSEEPLF